MSIREAVRSSNLTPGLDVNAVDLSRARTRSGRSLSELLHAKTPGWFTLWIIFHLQIVSTQTLMKASLASDSEELSVLSTAILARSPTMQCWSAPWTTS